MRTTAPRVDVGTTLFLITTAASLSRLYAAVHYRPRWTPVTRSASAWGAPSSTPRAGTARNDEERADRHGAAFRLYKTGLLDRSVPDLTAS